MKKFLFVLFLLLTLILSSCQSNVDIPNSCTETTESDIFRCDTTYTSYLNTVVSLTIYVNKTTLDDERFSVDKIYQDVESTLSDFHELTTKYDPYAGINNVYEINQRAGEEVVIDQRLFDLISYAIETQPAVDNQFNIAIGPVVDIWHNYREQCYETNECALPSIEELQSANQFTDYTKLTLNPNIPSITLDDGMSIDLGGVSKGFISSYLTDILDGYPLEGYLLNNGESNISVGGKHPLRENGVYIVAITNPEDPFSSNYLGTIELNGADQLITSGDYQKYYTVDNTVYHHIIDPDTLFPSNVFRSITVITDNSAFGDILSTALFNMTLSEGKLLIEKYDNVDVLWVLGNGEVEYTTNFVTKYNLNILN
jgi:thiamine biosynthesis lipoprotein